MTPMYEIYAHKKSVREPVVAAIEVDMDRFWITHGTREAQVRLDPDYNDPSLIQIYLCDSNTDRRSDDRIRAVSLNFETFWPVWEKFVKELRDKAVETKK